MFRLFVEYNKKGELLEQAQFEEKSASIGHLSLQAAIKFGKLTKRRLSSCALF